MKKLPFAIAGAAVVLLLGSCVLLNPAWTFVNRSSYVVCVAVYGAEDFTETFSLQHGESHKVTPPDQLASAVWNNGAAFRWEWTPDTVTSETDSDDDTVTFRNR